MSENRGCANCVGGLHAEEEVRRITHLPSLIRREVISRVGSQLDELINVSEESEMQSLEPGQKEHKCGANISGVLCEKCEFQAQAHADSLLCFLLFDWWHLNVTNSGSRFSPDAPKGG